MVKGMWNKILNPKTGRMVNINGKVGKQILKKYLKMLTGGSLAEYSEHKNLSVNEHFRKFQARNLENEETKWDRRRKNKSAEGFDDETIDAQREQRMARRGRGRSLTKTPR
jgi:hypothetical protein